jgi:hypothetical protein
MDEIAAVGQVHGFGQRLHQPGRIARRQHLPRQPPGQRAALDEFHDEVRPPVQLAAVVNLDDVRMAKASRRFGLAQEPTPLLRLSVRAGQQHLQGDGTVETEVTGLVHDAHAAETEHRLYLVPRDLRQAHNELFARDLVVT